MKNHSAKLKKKYRDLKRKISDGKEPERTNTKEERINPKKGNDLTINFNESDVTLLADHSENINETC